MRYTAFKIKTMKKMSKIYKYILGLFLDEVAEEASQNYENGWDEDGYWDNSEKIAQDALSNFDSEKYDEAEQHLAFHYEDSLLWEDKKILKTIKESI